jgi:hypothetical protein
MPTQRQIEANRRNAQLSTGPRTPAGKAASSMNALKSGLDAESQFVIGEDRADFYALTQEYSQMIRPRNPCERFHMDRMIRSEWLLRRMFRAESYVWEYHSMRANRSEGVPLGEAWATASPIFMRIHRRNAALEKAYRESWDELQRLRGASAPFLLDPDPEPSAAPLPGETPVRDDTLVDAGHAAAAPPPEPLPQPGETTHQTSKLGSFPQTIPASPLDPFPNLRPPETVAAIRSPTPVSR